MVGTASLRLPKVCPEQILVERRGKHDKINKFLVNNDLVWQQFVANESLSLTPPVNESFPSLPDAILYGALSEPVHRPPGLAVLKLTDPPYPEHVYLLRDLGVHYSKKLNLFCESVDLSQALGDLMKRDLAS